jgi:hypothetical protein
MNPEQDTTVYTSDPEDHRDTDYEGVEDDAAPPQMEVPIGIVLARILIVTSMSFSAAVAIFCIVGALWLVAGVAALMTAFFLLLMFGVERFADH